MLIGFENPVKLRFRYDGKKLSWRGIFEIQKARIEQPAGVYVPHGGQHGFFDVRMLPLQFREDIAKSAPNGAGLLRAAAGDDRDSQRSGVGGCDVFRNEDQRPDKPEVVVFRVGDGRKRAELAGEHRIAKKSLAEIVS